MADVCGGWDHQNTDHVAQGQDEGESFLCTKSPRIKAGVRLERVMGALSRDNAR